MKTVLSSLKCSYSVLPQSYWYLPLGFMFLCWFYSIPEVRGQRITRDNTFGGTSNEDLKIITATPDGGYLLGGTSNSPRSGEKSDSNRGMPDEYGYITTDYWVIKIDKNGERIWDKTFGGSDVDNLTAVVASPDGGYLLGGTSRSGISGDKTEASRDGANLPYWSKVDYWLVKIDANGNKIWDKTLGGDKEDALQAIMPTPDGGYLLGGLSTSNKSGEKSENNKGVPDESGYATSDYWLIKIDKNGRKIWDKAYGGNSYDALQTITDVPDGYLLGGTSYSGMGKDKSEANKGEGDYWLIKINLNGNKLWDKTLGGNEGDELADLIITPDAGYLLAGTSTSDKGGDKSEDTKSGQHDKDYWLVRLDDKGSKLWDQTLGGNSNDELSGLVATADGSYLLSGTSESGISSDKTEANRDRSFTYGDYWVVKIDATGRKLWDKTLGSGAREQAAALVITSNGNYLLGGTSWSGLSHDKTEANRSLSYSSDFWIIELEDKGKTEQAITIKSISSKTLGEAPFAVSARANSNLPVRLSLVSGPATLRDSIITLTGAGTVTLKASQAGNTMFLAAPEVIISFLVAEHQNTSIGGNRYDILQSFLRTPDGGYLLSGISDSGKSGDKSKAQMGGVDCERFEECWYDYDYWVVKLDKNRQKVWDQTVGSKIEDYLVAALPTPDGGYLLGGYSWGGISGDKNEKSRGLSDYWVVKIDAKGQKVWDKTFGSDSNDNLSAVVTTPDGGYLLAGTSWSNKGADKTEESRDIGQYFSERSDYWVVKIDANGQKVWDKTFGGSAPDGLSGIITTPDGNYLLTGISSSGVNGDKSQANRGESDFWVIKINQAGKKIWDKTFGGSSYDGFNGLIGELCQAVTTPDGGYLLAGTSNSGISGEKSEANKGSGDYWMIKIDKDGNKLWDKTFGGNSQDALVTILVQADGNYVLGGRSTSNRGGDKSDNCRDVNEENAGTGDFWVVKVNAAGKKLWDKTLGGDDADWLTSILTTPQGGYLLAGSSASGISSEKSQASKGHYDYWLLEMEDRDDLNKVEQAIAVEPILNQSFSGKSYPITIKAEASSGLPVIFNLLAGPANIKGNMITVTGVGTIQVKASQPGNATYLPAYPDTLSFQIINSKPVSITWEKTLGGSNGEGLSALITNKDGSYILGGTSASGLSNDKTEATRDTVTSNSGYKGDYWVVKVNSQGKKVWDKTFGGSNYDQLAAIAATPDGGYLLGGTSWSGVSGDKTAAVKDENSYTNEYWFRGDYWIIKIDSSGQKVWDKTYGGAYSDELKKIVITTDGGYLLAGSSYSGAGGDKSESSRGDYDYWVVKIDGSGKKLWDKTFGGRSGDFLSGVIANADGSYLLGGSSSSAISGDKSESPRDNYPGTCEVDCYQDYWVIKMDARGQKIWDKTFGGKEYDGLSALAATSDGGYLLAGSSSTAGIGGNKSQAGKGELDYWILKIDSSGQKIWDQVYGGSAWDKLTAIMPTTNGGYLLAGSSTSEISGDKSDKNRGIPDEYNNLHSDFWVLKITEEGSKVWDKTFGGNQSDDPWALVAMPGGNYLLGGTSDSGISGEKSEVNRDKNNTWITADFWVVKIQDVAPPALAAWKMRFGGNRRDNFTQLLPTSDGGYLAGGYSASTISGDRSQNSRGHEDFWVVKTDALGYQIWDKRYGGTNHDYLNSIIQTPDGGYLLGGSTDSKASGDVSQPRKGGRDFWVVKISGTGEKEWDKRYGGSGFEDLRQMLLLPSGYFILAGYSNSPVSGDISQLGQGKQDYWVVQIDSIGRKIWDKRFGGLADDKLESLILAPDGGFLIGGSSFSGHSGNRSQNSQGASDYWIVRTDGRGNLLWDKRYGGSEEDELFVLQPTPAGYLLAGHSASGAGGDKSQTSQGESDYWVISINKRGQKLWDKAYGGNQAEKLRSLMLTGDGGHVLGGTSFSGQSGDKSQVSQGSSDYWIIKTDSSGNKLWNQSFGGGEAEELRSIWPMAGGSYVLGGRSDSGVSGNRIQPSQGGTDYWLIKVPATISEIHVPNQSITNLKTKPQTQETQAAAKQILLKAFPNPFAERVTIRFALPETQFVHVKVYDSRGREVASLFNGEAQANQIHQLEWQASTQASGIYLVQLYTPVKSKQQKLILTR